MISQPAPPGNRPTPTHPPYKGRFAPSPTGDLHFGSLVAAAASWLQAHSNDGQWLVRVEDLDPPREIPGSAQRILADLNRLGLRRHGAVAYQSQRQSAYDAAIAQLLGSGLAFHCGCSRSDLPKSGRYPGTCRNGIPAGRSPRSVRLRVDADVITFDDLVQGPVEFDLGASVGDFVIQRADGLTAYQLAVAVDDAWQGITEIVRGADLLDSTPRQILVQSRLGLPTPSYAHVPVARRADGEKLSKQFRADPVASMKPEAAARLALEFLGMTPPPGIDLQSLWEWAAGNWSIDQVPKTLSIRLADDYLVAV